jgi:hypothetical protein
MLLKKNSHQRDYFTNGLSPRGETKPYQGPTVHWYAPNAGRCV